jgi:hypothetical protein
LIHLHYKKEMFMKKMSLVSLAFTGILGLASIAQAGNYTGGATIGRMWVDGYGVNFGTSVKPSECSANLYGAYYLLPISNPDYKTLAAVLLAAKTTGSSIDVWYPGSTGTICNTPSTLLQVVGVGFSN